MDERQQRHIRQCRVISWNNGGDICAWNSLLVARGTALPTGSRWACLRGNLNNDTIGDPLHDGPGNPVRR